MCVGTWPVCRVVCCAQDGWFAAMSSRLDIRCSTTTATNAGQGTATNTNGNGSNGRCTRQKVSSSSRFCLRETRKVPSAGEGRCTSTLARIETPGRMLWQSCTTVGMQAKTRDENNKKQEKRIKTVSGMSLPRTYRKCSTSDD
jgi:hypothetical protein